MRAQKWAFLLLGVDDSRYGEWRGRSSKLLKVLLGFSRFQLFDLDVAKAQVVALAMVLEADKSAGRTVVCWLASKINVNDLFAVQGDLNALADGL